jgi:cysteine-rich repeat protein
MSARFREVSRTLRVAAALLASIYALLCLTASRAEANATIRASLDDLGIEGNGPSESGRTGGNGRFVTFSSAATNLVANDTNARNDCFVRDTFLGMTARVSVDSLGVEINKHCESPDISGDGRFVAFSTTATNLIPDDTNGDKDCYLHDRDTDGDSIFDEPGAISTVRVSLEVSGAQRTRPSDFCRISEDGTTVVFQAKRTSSNWDVFTYDVATGGIVQQNANDNFAAADGTAEEPSVSGQGRYIAFESSSSNLVPAAVGSSLDIYVVDRDTDENGIFDEPGSRAVYWATANTSGTGSNGPSRYAAISDDGLSVAFSSQASDLVANDSNNRVDVFVHDLASGETLLLSRNAAGNSGDADSYTPEMSGNGRFVVFASAATDLVPSDTNGKKDVFRYDRDPDRNGINDDTTSLPTVLESIASGGSQGTDDSGVFRRPDISNDGLKTVFSSAASDLVADDANATRDIFLAEGEFCGNGVVLPPEQCEDGNLVNGDGCDNNCTFTACGNGVVAGSESCDDGNLVSGDGCDANCTPSGCGNGITAGDETCDDGNLTDGDGCDSNCTETGCGNGIETAGEECDDGVDNGVNGCCTDSCIWLDYDVDDICDEEDLSELGGAVLTKGKIKDSKVTASIPNGVITATVVIEFDPGSPYPDIAAFLGQASQTGFSVMTYAGGAEPTSSDTPIHVYEFAAHECLFSGDGVSLSKASCRDLDIPPQRGRYQLKATSGKVSKVIWKATGVDVKAPTEGPMRLVLSPGDPNNLDFMANAVSCFLKTGSRATMKCR